LGVEHLLATQVWLTSAEELRSKQFGHSNV
jgi:hypothetical protein